MPSSKKRVFDTVRLLESQDAAVAAPQKDLKRSRAAQSQTSIYGSLVECRILLQRSMTALSSSSSSSQSNKKQKTAADTCNRLLEDLLKARHKLTRSQEDDPEYDKLLLSSDGDEALRRQLQKEYQSCRDEWKTVLNRRHQDARLHAGQTQKFLKVMDASFWDQVESTVQHEQLRQRMSPQDNDQVFDDSKVYQHLLKDFCATAAASNNKQPSDRLRATRNKKKKVAVMDRRDARFDTRKLPNWPTSPSPKAAQSRRAPTCTRMSGFVVSLGALVLLRTSGKMRASVSSVVCVRGKKLQIAT